MDKCKIGKNKLQPPSHIENRKEGGGLPVLLWTRGRKGEGENGRKAGEGRTKKAKWGSQQGERVIPGEA